jgi:hypothetical protein
MSQLQIEETRSILHPRNHPNLLVKKDCDPESTEKN